MIVRSLVSLGACLLLAGCAGAAPSPTTIYVYLTPEPTATAAATSPGPGESIGVSPSTEPTDGATASTEPAPSGEPTVEPTDAPTDEPTDAPTDEPTDAPTASPQPTPSVPMTTLSLIDVGLSDPDNPESKDRTLSFASDGTANVTVKVDGVEPGQKVTLCLGFPGKTAFCQTTAGTTLIGRTTRARTQWDVTLRGATMGMVTRADLTITFPSKYPASASGEGFYLSGGQTYPGFTAWVTPRRNCAIELTVLADPPVAADVTIKDLTSPGSVPPAPASNCPPPGTGTRYNAKSGHKYQIGITSSASEESHASIKIRWP